MRKIDLIIIFSFGIFLGLCELAYSWGNKETHPALTDKAISASVINDYLKTQLYLRDGVTAELKWDFPSHIKERLDKGTAEPDKTTRTILEWVKAGSIIEDEDGRRWPLRSRHHFHDPNRNAGLDNQTDHNDWESYACTKTGFDFTGESALVWAIEGTAPNEPTINDESWQDARADLYTAFTQPADADRETFLAKTFLDLGCVLHMIEDVGVPAHTRNDFLFAHYRTWKEHGDPLEGWVEDQVKGNGDQSLWSGSGPVVFDKLAKCFDASRGPNSGDSQ